MNESKIIVVESDEQTYDVYDPVAKRVVCRFPFGDLPDDTLVKQTAEMFAQVINTGLTNIIIEWDQDLHDKYYEAEV